MGFDFYMVNKPEQAVGYRAELPDRPEWFRLNWRGMEAVLQGMAIANILETATPRPVLHTESLRKDENEALLATRSRVDSGVPYWKFMDNSGWFVHPDESELVALGLAGWLSSKPGNLRLKNWPESLPLDGYHALLREWIAFNRLAATHGGYRVR